MKSVIQCYRGNYLQSWKIQGASLLPALLDQTFHSKPFMIWALASTRGKAYYYETTVGRHILNISKRRNWKLFGEGRQVHFPKWLSYLRHWGRQRCPNHHGALSPCNKRALIDVAARELIMGMNDEQVLFNIFKAIEYPEATNDCFVVNHIVQAILEI